MPGADEPATPPLAPAQGLGADLRALLLCLRPTMSLADASTRDGEPLAVTPAAPPEAASAPVASRLLPALAIVSGFTLLAFTNAVAIAVSVPWPRGGLPVRAAHHALDLAETIGLGLCAAAPVAAWRRWSRAPLWIELSTYGAASTVGMHAVLARDLWRQAFVALDGRLAAPLFWTFVISCGLVIPAAQLLGALFARMRRLWIAPLIVALGGVVTNHLVVRDDYPGLHGAIGWTAATLGGAALAPRVARWMTNRLASAASRSALTGVLLAAVAGLLYRPPNALRLELYRHPGAMAPWVLSAVWWPMPEGPAAAPPSSPWFSDRSGAPTVPPTAPPLFARAPVVVLLTIDALRADAVFDSAAAIPNLTEMMGAGVSFTRATSPGSQTAVSLTSAFSGRTFSQLYWSLHGSGSSRFLYAAEDDTPRFPETLSAHGVRTATFASLNFLAQDFGVIRGFAEHRMIAEGRRHAQGRAVIEPLLELLKRADDRPLFVYAHLMEPHAPYDRGALKEGPDKPRYMSEITVADALVGRVWRTLAQRFPDRGVLIVSADHGEAFGEHGTWQHTKTLYDELLRVPLLVRGPGVAHRTIDQRVGLIDLGPTILDLFGVPTPGRFMGQTLVPLLAGRDVALDRPMVAEGRLRRALYHGDLKVIDDTRRKVIEVYDLSRDPGESSQIFDTEPDRAAPAVAALRAFFAVHSLRRSGYTPPFKP